MVNAPTGSRAPNQSPPRVGVERWLVKLGRLLQRNEPRLGSWQVDAEPGRVRVDATFDGGALELVGRLHDDAPTWLRTRSAAWNITIGGGAADPPRADVAAFLETLRGLLGRGDRGDLDLPLAEHAGPDGAPGSIARRDGPAATSAREGLADELHRASFIAWKTLTSSDLYPHTQALGVPTPLADIEAGWVRTLARIRAGTAPDRLGLYVHIPFCAVECTFCFCGKTSRFGKGAITDYVDDLVAAMQRFGELFDGQPITSVYFGGGTPSLLKPELMQRLFETLYGAFHVPEGTQVIFEGNPDSLNATKIGILGTLGRVSRLTIGVQALDAETQRRTDRHNRPEEVEAAVAAARAVGIPHVNIDLMTGLDGQTMEAFQADLRFVLGLRPESVHINPFRPVRWSIFSQQGSVMSREQAHLRDEMLKWGRNALREHGFLTPLGQTSSATANAANLQEYDLRKQNSSLLGLGIPARSHAFGSHYYEAAVPGGNDVTAGLEDARRGVRVYRAIAVSEIGERHRYLVHNLRTGFSLAEFASLFGTTPWEAAPAGWRKLDALGLVEVSGDRVMSNIRNAIDEHVHRALLYGDEVLARVDDVWGAEYERGTDYVSRMRLLVEDDSRDL